MGLCFCLRASNSSETIIVVCGSSGGYPCSQAGVLVKFALISRAHAKITTTTASVHGGARSAPPCTQAVIVIIFTWAREINSNLPRCPPGYTAVARFSRKSQYCVKYLTRSRTSSVSLQVVEPRTASHSAARFQKQMGHLRKLALDV